MAYNRNRQDQRREEDSVQHPAADRREQRNRNMPKTEEVQKLSNHRSHLSSRERDNDLYERQSI